MKKLILILAALGLCTINALAQGQLTVASSTPHLVYTNSANPGGSGASTSAGGYEVQLYYLPGNLPAPTPIDAAHGNLNGWEPMAGAPVISVSVGTFSGGTETTGNDVAPNGAVWLELIGWNGGYSSLQAALVANAPTLATGESAVWSQLSGSGAPGTPATISTKFPGLLIENIPEPSVMVLSGLGAIGLLLFRRKK